MKNQFTWEPFSVPFIQSICYSEKTRKDYRPNFETENKGSLLPYIDSICSIPDEHFVHRYYHEILDYFLAGSTHLISVVKALEKHRYSNIHTGSMDEMQIRMKRLRLSSTVLTILIAELKKTGEKHADEDLDVSIFTTPKTIDLTRCSPSELPMYDYQTDAIQSLKQHFLSEDKRAGVLVMPTGSGKTRVASRFLIESMVAEGWQVIWLTHRAMLIEQTAQSIYDTAGALLRQAAPEKDTFRMICVSGSHASIRAAERNADVLICGVQSLSRNLPFLPAIVRDKVMVVVDEAHHTLAPSYRLTIEEIRKYAGNVKLLGLTATPVKLRDIDTERLMTLFDHTIVYNVSMSSLIARGFLSEPQYEKIDTGIDFDTTVSLDEKQYIKKWGELSPETVQRMADITERNALIVDTYLKNRQRYGKTLMFALNAAHCISLCEELQKKGVRCDYIYCRHPGNAEKIARFQSEDSNGLEVLVNIQILTEGSDVPKIQTVFLTRPTSSDTLLMQMIGRGMRGVSSGGTATVNIVDFHDIWGSFTNWLNPSFLLGEERDPGNKSEKSSDNTAGLVPWASIREILDGIHTSFAQGNPLLSATTLPVGWYDVLDEDGNDSKVLVFESQVSGYHAMWERKSALLTDSYTGGDALRDFFGGFGLLPNEHELQLVLDIFRLSKKIPHLNLFLDRKNIEPEIIATHLKNENVGVAELDMRIMKVYDEHSQVIDSIYGGAAAYIDKVIDFICYPSGCKPLGMRIEELPEESLTLDRTPLYDLAELVGEVVHERFDDAYGPLPPINWTDKPYSTYFGVYYAKPSGNFIRINCLLNSKDVPREAVKYVIYHELLHRDNWYHDAAFRALEHQYPAWTEHEHFLDDVFPKFDLRYAL